MFNTSEPQSLILVYDMQSDLKSDRHKGYPLFIFSCRTGVHQCNVSTL